MADKARAQIIQPPDRLRARLGGSFSGIDPAAIARAEAALQAMSGQFAGWLEEEVARLEVARGRLHAADADPVAMEELRLRVHDLKGLGGTSGFPLVSRVCASLSRLLDPGTMEPRAPLPLPLIDAHVNAVRRFVRDGVRDPAHPVGLALCQALEAQVVLHRGAGG